MVGVAVTRSPDVMEISWVVSVRGRGVFDVVVVVK